jgi:hypothetical protein
MTKMKNVEECLPHQTLICGQSQIQEAKGVASPSSYFPIDSSIGDIGLSAIFFTSIV